MANVVLGIGTGHASTLGSRPDQVKKIAERDEHDPRIDYAALLKAAPPDVPEKITEDALEHYYELCLRGVAGLKAVLDESAPDVVIVIGDDQHEQFLDDGLPMLALFNGEVMHIVRRTRPWDDPQKGWDAQDTRTEFPGHPELANHLLRSLCSKGFDLARSNALRPNVGLGHAFVNPYRRYFPDRSIPMIPFMVNTYFPPNQPTPGPLLRPWACAAGGHRRVAFGRSGLRDGLRRAQSFSRERRPRQAGAGRAPAARRGVTEGAQAGAAHGRHV